MPQFISFYLVWNRRAWTNDAHVAAQHIQKLRHFIKTKSAQHSADARDAWIVTQFVSRSFSVTDVRFSMSGDEFSLILAMDFAVGIDVHGTKFVNHEYAAIHAHAFLGIRK